MVSCGERVTLRILTLLLRHWPIGLLYDYHTTSSPSPLSLFPSSPPPPTAGIFPLTLHLSSPPTEQLLISNSIEVCKTGFMHQLKEADFVRWGNTKRVVNLRREEQGGIWEGVVESASPPPLTKPLLPRY